MGEEEEVGGNDASLSVAFGMGLTFESTLVFYTHKNKIQSMTI